MKIAPIIFTLNIILYLQNQKVSIYQTFLRFLKYFFFEHNTPKSLNENIHSCYLH